MRTAPLVAVAVAAVALAGCGSAPPKTTSTATVVAGSTPVPVASASPIPITAATGGEQHYTVHVGDKVQLLLPAGSEVSEAGTREVADIGGGVFKAVGVGTASLEVVRRPPCARGQQCSNLVQLIEVVEITVKV